METYTESWSAMFKHKPILDPAIESFEIELDNHPTFNGPEELTGGTDLGGVVKLDLASDLTDVQRVVVVLHGMRRVNAENYNPRTSLPSPNLSRSNTDGASTIGRSGIVSSSDIGETLLTGEKELWKQTPQSSGILKTGHYDWRVYFKLPGNLPKTIPGEVAYTIRAVIVRNSPAESASSTSEVESGIIEAIEEVIVRRVFQQGGDPAPGYSEFGAPPPEQEEPPAYF